MRWHRWIIASLSLHATAVGLATRSVRRARSEAAETAGPSRVDFDLEVTGAPGTSREASPEGTHAESARLGGRRAAQNVDAPTRGEGGDGRSVERGLNLAARAEGVNLDPRILNNLHERQEQRIRTSATRGSPQDDRRTPNPADDPWVSTGHGVILFRLPSARALPARGAAVSPGAAREAVDLAEAELGTRPVPLAAPRLGAGVAQDLGGARARTAGPMRTQRPTLDPGHASTTADRATARPDDDTDSALLAASLQRAYVSATVHAGPMRGEGVGGAGGGGAPGSGGGEGRGGRAGPIGDGDGWVSLSSDDARYMRYLIEVRRRLEPLWADAFPREEALRLRQGTVILQFVIARDGAVRDASVRRRSGVDRFDQNVLDAVRRARLPPIPAALGREQLAIRAPFEFRNPLVR